MTYHYDIAQNTAGQTRLIAASQIDRAIEELTDSALDSHEAVHQARKRFKKIRGLLRLVRGALGKSYRQENAWFRDRGRELSELRDTEARLETLNSLEELYGAEVQKNLFEDVRRVLRHRQARLLDTGETLTARTRRIAEELRSAKGRLEDWTLAETGFGLVKGGLEKTYRRARKAMKQAYRDETPEAFHEWRKRVKYHWYHTRLLREVWPEMLHARRKSLKDLADLLGDSHDLAVLHETLTASPKDFGPKRHLQTLLGLMERRDAELLARAHPLGHRLFAEKPATLRNRWEEAWHAAREEQRTAPLPGQFRSPSWQGTDED